MNTIRLSPLEHIVLQMLISKGVSQEVYGLELVQRSDGILKKGTVYVTLGRMEEKGYLNSRKEEPRRGERGLPRRLYKISALGNEVLRKWESELNRAREGYGYA